ncbi:beta-N-acetylhexosaminidase [Echinicola pacifica]|nr:family 20 glycosylhydrolase [Echinicola pacifica]
MNKFIIGFLVLITQIFVANAQESSLALIPYPWSVEQGTGEFLFTEETIFYLPQSQERDLGAYIQEKLLADQNMKVQVKSGSPKKGEAPAVNFLLTKNKEIEEEGYILSVQPSSIQVEARTAKGLFYAFQTLRQLMPVQPSALARIPSVEIKDHPRFEWRGLMIDVSRHFRSKEFVKKQIDIIAAYKMNKFHWHLTDDQGWRVEIRKYPNLTDKGAWRADRTGVSWWKRTGATAEEPKSVGGFYTQEDIKEVIEFARLRNVEIIPEIDVPGHSKALVSSYPFLSCLDSATFEVAVGGKAPDNALCAGKESTYDFMEEVIGEIAGLFPSQYIHIGGDECNKTNWKKCPHCQAVKEEHGLADEEELQSYFIQRMNKLITANDKKMIAWDEVLSGNGAKGAVIMAWRRGAHSPQLQAPQEGYPTIMTSYTYSYISQVQGPPGMEPEGPKVVLPLSKVYSQEPVPEALSPEQARLIKGTEVCLWSEFTPTAEHTEYMLYPRTIAHAEVAWTVPAQKDWQRFQEIVPTHFQRLEQQKITVSNSLYSIYGSYAYSPLEQTGRVFLETETEGYRMLYTLDGTAPTSGSEQYHGFLTVSLGQEVKAGLFDKEGQLLGEITSLKVRKDNL